MRKIFIILTILILSLAYGQIASAADLSAASLSVNPLTTSSSANWVISFTIPQDTKLGHIIISLTGHQPDLSSAELFVSGLPQGNPVVGKSNPNCVFNCDDIRYYYTEPISIKKGTKVTFTLNKVKNSSSAGETGINYIDVFSSKYPQMTLAFSGGEQIVNLVNSSQPVNVNTNSAQTNTNQAPESLTDLAKLELNELFFQQGAKTTKFDQITDPTKVQDLTLDLLGKEKVIFKGTLDLSQPDSLKYLQNISDYLIFDHLKFEVKKEILDYFKVPLSVTFYDLPFVWDPDILINNEIVPRDKIKDYKYVIFNNVPQVSFTINDAGTYQLIPHLELYISDNQKFYNQTGAATFSGRISDPKAVIRVDLNGTEQRNLNLTMDQNRGEFTFSLVLTPGANLIEVQAKSEFGEVAKISKLVDQAVYGANNGKTEAGLINIYNIAAVVLALLLIFSLWTIRRMAKKRR